MRFAICSFGCMALAIALGTAPTAVAAESSRIGQPIENFELRDYRGKVHSLSDYSDSRLIVLAVLGNDCPLAKLYGPRLAELAASYEAQGVTFLGLNPNRQDAVTEIAAFARLHGIEFPILKDAGNVVADQIGAQRTPEVFVLDDQRVVRYWGRVDDQYGFQENGVGYQLPAPRRRDLAEALDELLAGKPVSQAERAGPGCLIGRIREPNPHADVTYSNQIARILNRHCVECHREGQIGPFPLTSYEEVVGWSDMIREVVQERRMPPWHADPAHGEFSNDARLSEDERGQIFRWVQEGAPEGDPAELPETPQFAEGWMIPEPDVVLYMDDEPYTVPAEGTVDYVRFVVDPGWEEDKWIKAIEPRPGNPAVVHHIVMYIVPPRGPQSGVAGRLRNDWLAAYAPGLRPQALDDGWARYFPKGAKLVFELHYTPNGTEQTDRSYLGIKFADPETVQREVAVKQAGNFSFRIPPHADNHEVESEYKFREETLLLSVSPHMHVRGKDFRYDLIYPDGRRETILDVPNYDFGWQTTYMFTEPKVLPPGTVMHCVAHFDNSENNLNNPDPSVEVRWGQQTWEEMMFGWFEMALVDQDLTQPQPERVPRAQEFLALVGDEGLDIDKQLTELANRALINDDEFKFFCYYVLQNVPQLDRVCVTAIEEDRLRPRLVCELNGLESAFRTSNTTIGTKGQELATCAEGSDVEVFPNLEEADGSMLRLMYRRGVQSSMHVPIVVDGARATVNFWSTEPDAFPQPAVDYLTEVARLLHDK